ncbi:MAG: redoxin domain-containing protein [Deltaproteobacteria bacterium]|nr:redoxin domain-containing protein [Deltaproteobacteria bacterium]
MTAFVYESERYVPEGIQILGVSVQPAEEARKLRDRVTRDCQEDRPYIRLDPYPLRLLSDPQGELIRAVGAGDEGHWSGFVANPVTFVVDPEGKVQWCYRSHTASDRPSPVALAKTAVTIAQGQEPSGQ